MDDFSKKSTCGKCYWVRTIILTAVLLATLGFVIFQKDGFMVSRKYINDMKVPKTTLEAKYELKNNPELVKTDMERYLANQSSSRSMSPKCTPGQRKVKQTWSCWIWKTACPLRPRRLRANRSSTRCCT